MLHGRYEIGAYAYSAGSENRYLAWDHLEKRIVQIQELFLSGSTMRIPGKPEAVIIEFRKNDFNSELERFLLYSERFLRFECCDSIIQVTDVFCENNTAYRVKDYVGGVPLDIYLKEKCVLSVDEAITLICSVLNALKVIHKNEMLHSDLNPHNIILSGEKAVVEVVDCGTAFHYLKNRSKHSRSTFFTPGYASPELYTCRAERLGPWVDLYAVAALLFQMLTGTKPDECTDRMVGKDSVEEVLDRVQTIPKELKNVIMMGMELDYKKRFQTAESFHDAVQGKIRVEKKRNVLGRLSWKCYTV